MLSELLVKPHSSLNADLLPPLAFHSQGTSLTGKHSRACLWPWSSELVLPTLVPSALHSG